MQQGKFREDLFHRLNVVRVNLPALKDRPEDIEQLTQHFLAQAATELGVTVKHISQPALKYLSQLSWPGNVRQLENVCRNLTVMASGREIQLSDIPAELKQDRQQQPEDSSDSAIEITPQNSEAVSDSELVATKSAIQPQWQQLLQRQVTQQLQQGQTNLLAELLPAFERILIDSTLQHCQGKRQLAADKLGWGRNTLTRKIKSLKLNRY